MYPWLIHHFRVTLFTVQTRPVPDAHVEGLFEGLTGVPPEADEWRGNKSVHRRSGNDATRRFELMEQPNRLDFTVVGPTNLEIASFTGTLESAALSTLSDLDSLKDITNQLFEKSEPPVRLAVAGLLYLPATSVHESYLFMRQLIPALNLDYDHTSDFMLQINRFTTSSVVNTLRLNRLGIFSSVSAGLLAVPPMSTYQGSGLSNGVSYWTQLAVDINTAQGNVTPFGIEIFNQLRDEMFEAFRFVSEGVK